MSILTNKLPSFPDSDYAVNNYLLLYNRDMEYYELYRCYNTDIFSISNGAVNAPLYDGIVDSYYTNNGAWVSMSTYSDYAPSFSLSVYDVVSCGQDLFMDGEIYTPAVPYSELILKPSTISTSISSSTLLTSLKDIRFLFPALVCVLCACVGVRYAVSFILNLLRGA